MGAIMFSGVLSSRSRGPQKISPSAVRARARAAVEMREVLTAVFIRSMRLAPKSWEMTTLHPMLIPSATAM